MIAKIFEKLKSRIANSKEVQWYIFFLMVVMVFAKNILFNWLCFSATQENFYLNLLTSIPQKIVPALFIGSFVFIAKRAIWTVVVNMLIDIWIIANLFYFKANGYLLSYEVITMVGNMDGFWSSLQNYMGWDIIISPILTLVYALLIPYSYINHKKNGIAVAIIFTATIINIGDQVLHKMHQVFLEKESTVNIRECLPFSHVIAYADAEWIDYNYWSYRYVNKFSIVSYFPAVFIYRSLAPIQKIESFDIDDNRLMPYLSVISDTTCIPKTNLVFILVESLESWPLSTICGIDFMPNLNEIAHDDHILYCPNLKSQVVHGNSADGQLIDITGLLPISDGVVCNSFYNNTYPSLAQCYDCSAIINPSPGVWKQNQMTKAYHFGSLIEPKPREKWNDADVSNQIINYIDSASQPFCLLGITISSHVPFSYGVSNPKYTIEGMPAQMNAYLNCMAYVDSCIGVIYRHIRSAKELSTTTTLVITGDHTIFRSYDKEMVNYAKNTNIDFQPTKTFIPMIVYSPLLAENIRITEKCYQMDIYPTTMHLIGNENYFWKGLGVNLSDTTMVRKRFTSEEEAYELSNMLIRSDWFSNYISASELTYIAHAGGSIDGYTYTNSLEAVEHALSNGVQYIEMDLCMTTDSVVVAAHDWRHFHEISGFAGDTIPIPLAEFCSRKIYDKYTPITYAMIDSLMDRNPDMYLVTDKISSPRILSQFSHRDRIIVEARSIDDYSQLDTMGYHRVFYGRKPKTKYRETFNMYMEWLKLRPKSLRPTRYAFGCRKKIEDYKHLYGEEYAIYSLKNKEEADSLSMIDKRIKYVYIDDVE